MGERGRVKGRGERERENEEGIEQLDGKPQTYLVFNTEHDFFSNEHLPQELTGFPSKWLQTNKQRVH